MPTYQYACTECGHEFDAFQSFTDSAFTDCPICEGKLRKVYGSVGVVFKGSGFYRTDSRAGADLAKKAADRPAKEKVSSGSSSDSSTSSTPASSSGSSTSSTAKTSSSTTSSASGSGSGSGKVSTG